MMLAEKTLELVLFNDKKATKKSKDKTTLEDKDRQ